MHDVGMADAREMARLTQIGRAIDAGHVKELDRDISFEIRIPRPIHAAESPRADLLAELEISPLPESF